MDATTYSLCAELRQKHIVCFRMFVSNNQNHSPLLVGPSKRPSNFKACCFLKKIFSLSGGCDPLSLPCFVFYFFLLLLSGRFDFPCDRLPPYLMYETARHSPQPPRCLRLVDSADTTDSAGKVLEDSAACGGRTQQHAAVKKR